MDVERAPEAVPTIPVPRPDVESLWRTCEALKQVVEGMMRASGPLGARRRPQIFIQNEQPTHAMQEGDFWLCGGQKTTLSIFVGGTWHTTGTLV